MLPILLTANTVVGSKRSTTIACISLFVSDFRWNSKKKMSIYTLMTQAVRVQQSASTSVE